MQPSFLVVNLTKKQKLCFISYISKSRLRDFSDLFKRYTGTTNGPQMSEKADRGIPERTCQIDGTSNNQFVIPKSCQTLLNKHKTLSFGSQSAEMTSPTFPNSDWSLVLLHFPSLWYAYSILKLCVCLLSCHHTKRSEKLL